MRRLVVLLLGLLAVVPLLGASCAGQSQDVTACVERISARGSGDAGKTVSGIAREVERLRGLRFRALPRPQYIQEKEMSRRIKAELDRTSGRGVEASQRALTALGAIPKGTNLKELAGNELASQVAGYYDPRTKKLVVLSDAEKSLDAFERVTLSHELEHALADQRLTLPGDPDAHEPPQGGEDADTAEGALVEGDATLTMEAFANGNLSAGDALSVLGSLGSAGSSGSLPHYLDASETFPYLDGEAFVCHLYERGGWAAVDKAYRRPPVSTAQILFPGRYDRNERPVAPPPAPSPGAGWKRFYRSAVGAADLLWLFEAPGDRTSKALSSPRARAAAWAGGHAVVWTQGRRTALTMALVERRGARPRLCASMRAWAKAAGKPAGAVTCAGRVVRVDVRA
jgi:hypothetical protein